MMVHYVHAQKTARDAQERYIAELEIAPDEHAGVHCGCSKLGAELELL